MRRLVATEEHFYTGAQLRSGWLRETFGLEGDAIVAFTGGCEVSPEHMLDTEDLRLGHGIRAARMLHFIVEHPGISLDLAVARQRLLVCLAQEILEGEFGVPQLERDGDDLYHGAPRDQRKLSISIAAVSPLSGLIHFAVNLDPTGAPVPAIGLEALGVDPATFAERLTAAYVDEIASCEHAAAKVREAR